MEYSCVTCNGPSSFVAEKAFMNSIPSGILRKAIYIEVSHSLSSLEKCT
jgi:hypothetical protein